nr:dodecenoyl-CoA Delta-isomerase (EC 5.3.3.8), hepatic - bovine (fragments) [Bos taurus]
KLLNLPIYLASARWLAVPDHARQ